MVVVMELSRMGSIETRIAEIRYVMAGAWSVESVRRCIEDSSTC